MLCVGEFHLYKILRSKKIEKIMFMYIYRKYFANMCEIGTKHTTRVVKIWERRVCFMI